VSAGYLISDDYKTLIKAIGWMKGYNVMPFAVSTASLHPLQPIPGQHHQTSNDDGRRHLRFAEDGAQNYSEHWLTVTIGPIKASFDF
tara:strand:+ start:701 stop:961 length:261 start_codon:yes stop_codon:yes gene_type:complete